MERTIRKNASVRTRDGVRSRAGVNATITTARRRLAATIALWLAAGLAILALPASAGPGVASLSPPRKVLIVVIDRIGLGDLSEANSPNILRLAERGGVALMNARVRYDVYGQGGYVILGAGGRALGGFNSGLAFNSGELLQTPAGDYIRAGDLYRARTGRRAAKGSVVNLYIEEMRKKSDVPQAGSVPGLLGEAVRKGGKRAALVGNADSLAPATQVGAGYQAEPVEPIENTPGSYPEATLLHREASCIAMDENGLVPSGNVSSDLYTVSRSAAGLRTDFKRLVVESRAELATSDLLVVDMGQTSRVDEQAAFYSDKALDSARATALGECDRALGVLVELIDTSRDMVVVCTPTPTRKMIADGDLLTPLVVAGPGFTPGRRLGSPTTRRVGMVSNYDVAPTALGLLGVDIPAEMAGRELASSSAGADLAGLERFEERATGASNSRKAMVRVYVITSMVLVSLFFLLFLLREDMLSRHRFFWSLVMLYLLAGPLAYLVVPSFGIPRLNWLVPVAVGASVLLALAARLFKPRRRSLTPEGESAPAMLRPLLALSGATLLVILLDILLGSPLMSFSPFGSDVMLADRYYGVGNLYMGFAVGAALLFACLLITVLGKSLDRPWKRYAICGAVLAATAFIVGFGRLGANFGGLIAALAGGLVALVRLEGGRIGLKKAAFVVTVLVVCVAVLLAADMVLPGMSSHAGKAFSRAESSGASALLSQVSRKLAGTWSLTFASIWRLLLLLLVVFGLVLNNRFHYFRRIARELPFLYAGFIGMAVALPVAWLFNDSGIEAAAGISVFLFVPCFLLLVSMLEFGEQPEGG